MGARELKVAFLVSGEGSTLGGLADLSKAGSLPADIVLVVSDRPGAPALERARRLGLPCEVVPSRGHPPEAWAEALTGALASRGTELVVLAGFLSVLPPEFVARWAGRAVNLHPSLLPKYGGPGLYGARVHRAVLAAGETETGATVHLLTNDVDRGPVLAQVRIPVRPGETPESLRERLHPHEVMLLAETIRRFADGRLPLPYLPAPDPAAAPPLPGTAPGRADLAS